MLYSDSSVELLGSKHPDALGAPFMRVWADIREDFQPLVDQVLAGEPVHMDDISLMVDREGRSPEAHFAFSYTPVYDDDGEVRGFFCPCAESDDVEDASRDLVLIIDDADTRSRLRSFLDKDGCTVVEAENGQDGLDRLEHGRPGVILLN